MDELGRKLSGETAEMTAGSVMNPSEELRKRRSTRIVQAVPLVVMGVDALGRPFTERTSTLIINCHGCRYQSKHYVLKNMWVTLEVPNAEAGQPPKTVRGRVAWIQRPRTVRQLFQIALELEAPGNVWGIAFPPEDWAGFLMAESMNETAGGGTEPGSREESSTEIQLPLEEPDLPPAIGTDNLRVFPSPVSTTDASLQLARHVSRLTADAKQQVNASAREAAAHAVAAELRISLEEWDRKFAAARDVIAHEVKQAVEEVRRESQERSREAHSAAADALQNELPQRLAPQLEQLTRDLTTQISCAGNAQRDEHSRQLASAAESLRVLCERAEEAAAHLRTRTEEAGSQISTRADTALKALEETVRQRDDAANSLRESLHVTANEIRQQTIESLTEARASWQNQIAGETEAATARWQETLTGTVAATHEQISAALNEQSHTLLSQFQEETGRHVTSLRDAVQASTAEHEQKIGQLREAIAGAVREHEQRLAGLRDSLHAQTGRIEAAIAGATEASDRLGGFSGRLETVQQQALSGFQSQLDDVLTLHRNELHRRSESLFEELNGRIRSSFAENSDRIAAEFRGQIEAIVQPHVSKAEEAVHRLAGGRSLLDAALTLQQERIRTEADAAFAESLGRFRENLGGVEQLLQEAAQVVNARSLAEFETRAQELKHKTVEDLFKSAEWYEKKAQTQLQSLTERSVEQLGTELREKAGEVSNLFANELEHSSRGFISHTQAQMQDVVRDAFNRARDLFAEAADTTTAAFTDEIQRHAQQELGAVSEELRRAADEARLQMENSRAEVNQKVTTEQEEFLRRFQSGMAAATDAGVAEAHEKVQSGLAPLLDSWKSMTDLHQKEMRDIYGRMSDQSAESHRQRLENVSNQWMLATVASLDHQSREAVASIAASAEEKLRETCAHVFDEIGEALRERLRTIAFGAEKAAHKTAGR